MENDQMKGVITMGLAANPAQESAIRTLSGHVILVSCPGSGKTTTLIRRIHHMITAGIEPSSILMVTFTKDAARDMKEKYISLFGSNPGISFSTIHSLCFRILLAENKCSRSDVLRDDAKLNFLYGYFKDRHFKKDSWEMAVAASTAISVVKNNYIKPDIYKPVGISQKLFLESCRAYDQWMDRNGAIDYDDMLIRCLDLLKSDPIVLARYQSYFQYIQCDEYQDVNSVQRDILYALSERSGNLCVVGDDDQSIYAFRGAKPSIMLSFEKDFPDTKKIMMGTNYRSAQSIVDSSARLIRNNQTRFQKEFVSYRGSEGVNGTVLSSRFPTKKKQASYLVDAVRKYHQSGIPYNEIAVLFRTNSQAQLPASALFDAGIPYFTTESIKSDYESFIFSDIKDYVSLSSGTGSRQQLLNILNHPNRYLLEKYFAGCPYNKLALMDRIRYPSSGLEWKYAKAKEYINEWMASFGPGIISLDDNPVKVFNALDGISSIHYDRYLKEYAEFRNLNYQDLRDTYDSLQEDSAGFSTIKEWFEHADLSIRKLRSESMKKDQDGVVLTTMHSSKGLEWKAVFIIDADESVTPHRNAFGTPEAIEEERRLFYVAMTRAKDHLEILGSGSPSRFVKEISEKPKRSSSPTMRHPAKPKPAFVMDPSSVPIYKPGKEVIHKKYGSGRIVRYEPGKVVILFVDKTRVFSFPDTFARGILKYV